MVGPQKIRQVARMEAELLEAEREQERQKEARRIARQRAAFDDLPEGPVREHIENEMLRRAYDLMCEHQCEACDALIEFLPDAKASEMLDAWSDDFETEKTKSKWY